MFSSVVVAFYFGCVFYFITAGPSTKLLRGGGEDSGGHVLRETTSRGLCGLVCPSRTWETPVRDVYFWTFGFSFSDRSKDVDLFFPCQNPLAAIKRGAADVDLP